MKVLRFVVLQSVALETTSRLSVICQEVARCLVIFMHVDLTAHHLACDAAVSPRVGLPSYIFLFMRFVISILRNEQ